MRLPKHTFLLNILHSPFVFCGFSKARSQALILLPLNLKSALSIRFARLLLHLILAPMVGFLFSEGMQMNVYLNW